MLPWAMGYLLILLLAPSVQAFNKVHTNCTLPPQHANFVTAPNTRGTLQILWSSLFTILACTWTVLHLNIPKYRPKPTTSGSKDLLKWMVGKYQQPIIWFLITVLAPEVSFAKYWNDQVQAHSIFWHYKQNFEEKNWTKTHVLFVNMGGFALRYTIDEKDTSGSDKGEQNPETRNNIQPDVAAPAENETSIQGGSNQWKQFTSIFARQRKEKGKQANIIIQNPAQKFEDIYYLTATEALKIMCSTNTTIPGLEDISVEEIKDRSKTDSFMRILAIGQILWVIIQIISRATYGLAVTQLEVTVVAFAVCAVGIHIMNNGKPKGVNLPIVFNYYGTREELKEELATAQLPIPDDSHKKWKFYKCKYCNAENGTGITWDNTKSTRQTSSENNNRNHGSEDKTETPAVTENAFWGKVTHTIIGIQYFIEGTSGPGDPAGNGFTKDLNDTNGVLTYMTMFIGGTVFGGIHLMAWDFQFPTTVEEYLWRVAAMCCTASFVPCTLLFFVLLGLYEAQNILLLSQKESNISPPGDTGTEDATSTVSSAIPLHVVSNLKTDIDAGLGLSSNKNPIQESEKLRPLPSVFMKDEESQAPPQHRHNRIFAFVSFLRLIRLCAPPLSWFNAKLLIPSTLVYIMARLFIIVEMFRTLAFLPSAAYIATWSSEIPDIS
ncbi:hypothetical protein BO83DRAFT_442474 [Aspergillus eucalypticola CBS 122712]|uniref:Integral membrane protein n=1 Tax=Aspergillus eucalypticola (strain CBS 122712 / IBT 29274) TaxID=1448314 RepID=A0A317WLJ9_ASPEC|nr:uncharacterized protein BO83DRAFT_442474 [Aspergillus eucalypticola CBS 122712]PWY85100.1 hypothetical protein BO83DRAFT_442474 [Aspergillus eucalypticola CBS 122712]